MLILHKINVKSVQTWRHCGWRQEKLLPDSFFPATPPLEHDEDDDGHDVDDQEEADANTCNDKVFLKTHPDVVNKFRIRIFVPKKLNKGILCYLG